MIFKEYFYRNYDGEILPILVYHKLDTNHEIDRKNLEYKIGKKRLEKIIAEYEK